MEPFSPQWNSPRRFTRFAIDLRVVLVLSGPDKKRVAVRGTDISEGGIGLLSPSDLPLDTLAALEFTLPGSNVPVKVSGRICNRNGFRFGVEFIPRLCEEGVKAVRRYCGLAQVSR